MHFYSQIKPITITPFTVEPNTHYSENKGNDGRENIIKMLNISLL